MTPEAQRIAIAEVCGFENIDLYLPGNASILSIAELKGTKDGKGETTDAIGRELIPIPIYLNDLNAMHEAEAHLEGRAMDYGSELMRVIQNGCRVCDATVYPEDCGWHATAAQRAEAFLKTIGKWTEDPPTTKT